MKAEKLTKKVVDSITLDELVYAEYANSGAMGACGTARAYIIRDGKLHFYLAETYQSDEAEIEGYGSIIQKLREWHEAEEVDYTYGGFGNYAYRKKGASFGRDDDNYSFIYRHEKKDYSLQASCQGVYITAARTFTERRISIDAMNAWSANRNKLLDDEYYFLEAYKEFCKNDRVDTTVNTYFDAIDYIRQKNYVDITTNDRGRLIDGAHAIAKYRLKYVLEKIGRNKTESLLVDFNIKKTKPGGLFKIIGDALGEDLSAKFCHYEIKKSSKSDISTFSNDKELFKYPVVVHFTDEAHENIQKYILGCDSSELRALDTLGYYLASCNYMRSILPLAQVLPAALYVLKTMPFDDFNHTNTDTTYWTASEIVNQAWICISDKDDEKNRELGRLIHDACWHRIGGLWPIKNYGKYKLVDMVDESENPAGEYMLNEAIGFVACQDDLKKINPEFYDYLENEQSSKCTSVDDAIFWLHHKDQSDMDIMQAYYDQKPVFSRGAARQLAFRFPRSKKHAEALINELLKGNDGIFKESFFRRELWNNLLSLTHIKGVGKLILQKAVESSDMENIVDYYFSACYGVDEDDEIDLLAEFRDKAKSADPNNIEIDKAFEVAVQRIRYTTFQRESLRKTDFKKIRKMIGL